MVKKVLELIKSANSPRNGTRKYNINGFDLNNAVKLLLLVAGCEFAIEAINDLKSFDIPYISNMGSGVLAMGLYLAREFLADRSNIRYNEHKKSVNKIE